MLDATLPMFVSWGGELEFVYNDACRAFLGNRHPEAFGARFPDIWADIWPDISPCIDQALSGKTCHLGDARFATLHRPQHEDIHYSFTCTPIRDDRGRVRGIYGTGIEVSEELKNLRHSQVNLRRLNDSLQRRMQERTAQLRESEAHVHAIFDTTYQYMGVLDLKGYVLDSNRAALNGIKSELKDVLGVPFWETPWISATPGLPDLVRDAVFAVAQGRTIRMTTEANLPIGTRFFNLSMRPLLDADGNVAAIAPEAIDVTAEKLAQEEVRASEERWKLALEAAGDGVWDWDMKTGEVTYSGDWLALLGYGPDAGIDSLEACMKLVHPADAQEFINALQACQHGTRETVAFECRLRRSNGTWRWILNRGAIVGWDANGRPSRLVGTSADISNRKRSEQQKLEQANCDVLTGLPNRRLFRDRLEREVRRSRRTGMPFALLFVDLDRFKEVNDLLGHDAGDILLKDAAERIANCVREADTVARLGGDEFTIILNQISDVQHVEKIAGKILNELTRPFQILTDVVHIAGSIGITLYPQDGLEPESLVRNADQAMYVSKKSGRNRYSFFTPVIQEAVWTRVKLISDLRQVLANADLELYFQPMVNLADGSITKAEALLRWNHPERGLILPDDFISLAEETGLINEIGNWVFMESAAWSKRWSERFDRRFQISINKSPVQFMDDAYTQAWPNHLEALGLDGSNISIEITEGVLLNASYQISTQLAWMQEAGMQVAIDDFGTGYSSMAYLKKFRVDYLKVDQSFVRDMSADDSSRTIAETIIVMARRLGLKTIAEGVETIEQQDWLRDAGCDFAQGFLYAKPLPAAEFEDLLRKEMAADGQRRLGANFSER